MLLVLQLDLKLYLQLFIGQKNVVVQKGHRTADLLKLPSSYCEGTKTGPTPQDLWRCFCGIWLQEVNTRSLKWQGGVLLLQQIPQMLGQNQIREIWGLSQHLELFMFLKTLLNNFVQSCKRMIC